MRVIEDLAFRIRWFLLERPWFRIKAAIGGFLQSCDNACAVQQAERRLNGRVLTDLSDAEMSDWLHGRQIAPLRTSPQVERLRRAGIL